MEKIDYKKVFKSFYKASAGKVEIVTVPKWNYLMIDGAGNPNTSQAFQDAVEALFSLAYALKFMIKRGEAAIDYGVMPLEGLWWAEDMSSFSVEKKDDWKWTLMIMQPDLITEEMVRTATEQVKAGKNPVALPRVRFEALEEGKAAQVLHVGPFSEEGPTIEKLHQFIKEMGSRARGRHHEIYLSDIRRASPQKWKTIIRQPVI